MTSKVLQKAIESVESVDSIEKMTQTNKAITFQMSHQLWCTLRFYLGKQHAFQQL